MIYFQDLLPSVRVLTATKLARLSCDIYTYRIATDSFKDIAKRMYQHVRHRSTRAWYQVSEDPGNSGNQDI